MKKSTFLNKNCAVFDYIRSFSLIYSNLMPHRTVLIDYWNIFNTR